MARGSYKVRSITWQADEADSFDAYDDEDAADEWCKEMERNSNFSDGYPDSHELEVTAPDGTVTIVEVDTEFEPQYCCRTRGAQ